MIRNIISIIKRFNIDTYNNYGKTKTKTKIYNRNRIQYVLQRIEEEYKNKIKNMDNTPTSTSKSTSTLASKSTSKSASKSTSKLASTSTSTSKSASTSTSNLESKDQ